MKTVLQALVATLALASLVPTDALAKPQRVVLALSSAEALDAVLRQRPAKLETSLRRIAVAAASERLAQVARDAGFRRVAVAADARPAALLRAAADAFV